MIMEKNLDFFMKRISDSTLRAIAYELLDEGYSLIFSTFSYGNDGDFFSYEKDGRIGYVQVSNLGILSCSSQYKPSKDNGTGHRYKEGFSLSAEDVMKAKDFGFVKGVEPWESLEEFIKYKKKFCEIHVFSKN